jgi:hypothetical protein
LTDVRFAQTLKRVEAGSSVNQTRGPAERFFNDFFVTGAVSSDPASARADAMAAAGIIRRTPVDSLRGRNVFVITDGRKHNERQIYPFLVSAVNDQGQPMLFLLDCFSYSSATGAAIAKDLERPMQELALIGANTRAITTDNCANLLKALRHLAESLQREV